MKNFTRWNKKTLEELGDNLKVFIKKQNHGSWKLPKTSQENNDEWFSKTVEIIAFSAANSTIPKDFTDEDLQHIAFSLLCAKPIVWRENAAKLLQIYDCMAQCYDSKVNANASEENQTPKHPQSIEWFSFLLALLRVYVKSQRLDAEVLQHASSEKLVNELYNVIQNEWKELTSIISTESAPSAPYAFSSAMFTQFLYNSLPEAYAAYEYHLLPKFARKSKATNSSPSEIKRLHFTPRVSLTFSLDDLPSELLSEDVESRNSGSFSAHSHSDSFAHRYSSSTSSIMSTNSFQPNFSTPLRSPMNAQTSSSILSQKASTSGGTSFLPTSMRAPGTSNSASSALASRSSVLSAPKGTQSSAATFMGNRKTIVSDRSTVQLLDAKTAVDLQDKRKVKAEAKQIAKIRREDQHKNEKLVKEIQRLGIDERHERLVLKKVEPVKAPAHEEIEEDQNDFVLLSEETVEVGVKKRFKRMRTLNEDCLEDADEISSHTDTQSTNGTTKSTERNNSVSTEDGVQLEHKNKSARFQPSAAPTDDMSSHTKSDPMLDNDDDVDVSLIVDSPSSGEEI